jgi:hypothetical protein
MGNARMKEGKRKSLTMALGVIGHSMPITENEFSDAFDAVDHCICGYIYVPLSTRC